MRCKACNWNLSDRAASRKFLGWREITNTEDRYISLCDGCIQGTGLNYEEDQRASNEELQDENLELVELTEDTQPQE